MLCDAILSIRRIEDASAGVMAAVLESRCRVVDVMRMGANARSGDVFSH